MSSLPSLLVCRVFTTARRTGRHERHADWLVFVQIHLALSPRYARHLYRSRFGIETSYRCEGQVRGWTTAKNPAYRFVLIALAFVLLNVWIHLRWLFTQVPRRGGRWLDDFPFSVDALCQVSAAGVRDVVWLCPGDYGSGSTARVRN